MRMLLTSALAGALFVAAPASQSAQDTRPSGSLERPFTTNGRISMDLSAGEYSITGSRDNRIRMEWSVRDRDRLRRTRVRADIRGREATLTTDGPDNSNFKVAIEVPARADLHVRLTAGELTIDGIEGSKNVRLHAGELNIDVGRADSYSRVEASVWAGDVDAAPYQVSTGGLFRSFDWRGQGPYELRARVKAGEINLYSRTRSQGTATVRR